MEIGRIVNANVHIHADTTIETIQKYITIKFINQALDLKLHVDGLNSYLQTHVQEVVRRFLSTSWV